MAGFARIQPVWSHLSSRGTDILVNPAYQVIHLLRSKRIPLNTTSNEAPVSAAIANHKDAIPTADNPTNSILSPSAKAMFCLIVRSVRRARRTSQETLLRSSDMRAMSAVSIAASEPIVPMAIPTLAAAIAGESLTPIADHRDRAVLATQPLDLVHFVFGQALRDVIVDTDQFGYGLRRFLVVARQHDSMVNAKPFHLSNCRDRLVAYGVGQADETANVIRTTDHHDGMPGALQLLTARVCRAFFRHALMHQATATDPILASRDGSLGTATG